MCVTAPNFQTQGRDSYPIADDCGDVQGCKEISGELAVALDVEEPIVINPYHLISLKSRELSPLALRLRGMVLKEISAVDKE